MKALVATLRCFGSTDQFDFVEKEIPQLGPDEILLRGQFSTVSSADVRIRTKNTPRGFGFLMNLIFGFKRPRFESLGTDYLGVVIGVGQAVDSIAMGDRLAVDLGMKLNGYRTHLKVNSADVFARVPTAVLSSHAVAAVFAGTTALVYLRDKLKIRAGERILIIGAGGAVGSFAVQLAKYFGAEVTAICSQEKAEVIRSIGADQVVCYDESDFTMSEGDFDIVLDCVGIYSSNVVAKWVKATGRVGFVVADLSLNLKCLFQTFFGSKKLVAGVVNGSKVDLDFLLKLMAEQSFTPLIGKTYSFEDVVVAHQYVEHGHKLGSVLLEY